jgi:hypothetical protein
METQSLKKKLSVYLTEGGYLKSVSDEALFHLLVSWENWTGTSSEFYRTLGFTHRQMAGLLGKAKKLKREGHFGSPDFKVITLEDPPAAPTHSEVNPCMVAEIVLPEGKLIRFQSINGLIDFIKKSA